MNTFQARLFLITGIVLTFLITAPLVGQTNQYTWPGQADQSIYFRIDGSTGVHQALLDVDTGGDTEYLRFYLTYPDGTRDLLAYEEAEGPGKRLVVLRDDYNTDDEPPYGENIQFGPSETAGYEYALRVSKNDSAVPGIFSQDEIWGLTVAGLSGTNDVRALATARDTALQEMDPDPQVYANACLFRFDDPSVSDPFQRKLPILVEVPGGQNIHQVLLNVEFLDLGAAIDPNYEIYCPEQFDAVDGTFEDNEVASKNGSLPNDGSPETVPTIDGSTNSERIITLSRIAEGRYSIGFAQKNILDGTLNCGGTGCEYQFDEYWQVILSLLPESYQAFVSVETRDSSGDPFSTGSERDHLIEISRPPLSLVRLPANQPAAYPFTIVKQRNFMPHEEVFDFETGDIATLSTDWRLDGAPVSGTIAFSDYNPHSLKLISSESVDLNVPPYNLPATYQDIELPGADEISFRVIDPESMAFPQFKALPYHPDPPVIDGSITDALAVGDVIDTGWRAATRNTSVDAVEPVNVAFQALKDRNEDYYYFSFEVRNDADVHDEDLIVMGFRPAYSPSDADTLSATPQPDDILLFIHPLPDDGSTSATAPHSFRVYRYVSAGTDEYWDDVTTVFESQFTISSRSFDPRASWDVEIKMPFSTATGGSGWVDFAEDFLFYYNVFVVLDDSDPEDLSAVEFHWPRDAALLEGVVAPELFSTGEWGESSRNPAVVARGVYITDGGTDIWVEPSDGSGRTNKIVVGDNTFKARLRNNAQAEDSAGVPQPVTAEEVKVRFRIAKWGVMSQPGADTGDWSVIPVGTSGNGFTPVQNIAGDDTPIVFQKDWTVTQQWIDDNLEYLHQCVYVEIDAEGNANIRQKGYYRNMDFVSGSGFERIATISTKGYEPPPGGQGAHEVILRISRKTWSLEPGEIESTDAEILTALGRQIPKEIEDTVSYMRWIVHCYLKTGKGITINGNKYNLVKPMGSFGYIVRHDGPVRCWRYNIEGAQRLDKNTYKLVVPQNAHREILTSVRSIESRGLSLSLHGGAAIPVPPSSFAGDYRTGFCLIADAAYEIRKRWSLVGLFGYNCFPAKSTGIDDTSLLNVALNARYTLPIGGNMSLGVGVGPELFVQDLTSLDFGYDLDVNYGIALSRWLALALGIIYHSHFDQQVWFVQTQAGLILRL